MLWTGEGRGGRRVQVFEGGGGKCCEGRRPDVDGGGTEARGYCVKHNEIQIHSNHIQLSNNHEGCYDLHQIVVH